MRAQPTVKVAPSRLVFVYNVDTFEITSVETDGPTTMIVVEVIVTANKHMHFIGHATDDSMPTAVDKVVTRLERQVVKAKERLKDHRRGDITGKTS